MRKLLSLLVVLLASLGFTAWAQTMPFEAATSATDPDAQMYYIYQPGSQEYVKVTNGNILGSTFTGDQFIFVASNDANLFYVYNKSCGKFLTYTQTTDNGVSTKLTSQSVVKLVDTKDAAKTWRFVQEGSTDCFDIFPGEVASPNGNTASWNFRGGPDYALNFYKASDNNSSWQILGEIAGNMRCANKVFSLPGKPFMHKLLPNDGDEVLGVENLPPGLELKTDRPGYKYIYGTAPAAGEYTYKVNLNDGKSVDVGFTVSPDLTQPTPFMGVLTWNAFQGHINDANIKAVADAFETFGLKDLGYNYMCIDDQWAASQRTDGHLTWGTKFTDHAGVVDYVHNKGLKIGIYSDAGSSTCSGAQPGSYGYEVTDANDFLDWDFDLLKYDFCNATGGTSAAAAENAYKAMGDALKNAAAAKGKDFLFYMCEWGKRQPWEWGANTGATCWRATDDTRDYWSDTKYRGGVIQVLDIMKNIWAYQGVNRWNDADMLVVGLHGTGYSSNDGGGAGYSAGLTMDEARTNFALWCMFASPLTLSNNITNLDGQPNNLTGKNVTNNYYKEDLAIIRNKELIDLDQDPLGQAGEPIYDTNDYIVFQKDMADGSIALSITNLSSAAKDITVNFADLSALKSGEQYKMRDLWQHAYLDTDATSGVHKTYTKTDSYTVNVPKHGTYVYRIQRYDAEDLTWTEPTDPVVPEPETPVEGEWISEYPQTSTIAEPILYRIHNLGGDDGSYKGNDVYVQTQQSGIRFCDANGEADEFVFIDGGNSTVYIYDNTTSKYISWTTDAEGSCGWSGGKAINVVTRVQAVDDQASAKTWAIVDDENTAGRYDIKPTASSNNSWSYYGGVDQESVVLNLESKTNRNCKWMFERKVANAPEVEETAYVTASELRAKAATGRFAILGVTTTGDHYLNGAITGHVSTGGTLAGVREPNADEIVYFVENNGQYLIQRENNKKYFQIAAGGDINLVADASSATPFTIYGKGEDGYATGVFEDLFTDLTKEYNDYMIRFKANGQWLNTRSVSEVGGLRTGTGAWSFQYVRYVGEQDGSSVDPETPAVGEWISEYPQTSTIAEPITYRIHNIGADEGNSKGHNNYVAYNEAYAGMLQHIGGTEADRDAADEFIFIEAAEGVYIYDKTVEKYVKWTDNAEGGINWSTNSVSAARVVLVDSQADANTWFIVNDENTEGRYDILPTATSQYGWSFMGGTDRAWVVLNLESKTNRNCKWVFERQDNAGSNTTVDLIDVAGLKASASLVDGKFASNTVWYTIANQQTNQTGYISTAYTNGAFLATTNTTKDASAAGLWCIVGDTENGFKFYNKAAGPDKVLSNNANTASGMVDASATTNVTFILSERATKGVWSIKDFGTDNNYWCGSGNKLGHWDHANAANDNNCRFVFEEVEGTTTPVEPEVSDIFSTADEPVFWGLQFNKSHVYVSDKGLDNLAETTSNFVTGWALIGNADGFKLLDTKGNYMGVKTAVPNDGNKNAGPFCYATNDASAETFKLLNDNGTTFEIARASAPGTSFNPWGGQKAGINIGFWTAGSDDNKLVRVDIKNIEYFVASEGALAFNKPSKHTLWYNEPAPTDYNGWQEYSLPIGNGEFGGSIFGGVATDKITFNEKSLWDGNSSTRDNGVHGEYLKFGSIWVTDHSAGIADGVTDYVRYLDIDNAVAGVEYKGANNVKYTRTFIASQPAKALIGEYKASDNAKLDLTFSVVPGGQMVSRSTTKPTVRYNADGSATFDGKLELLSYAAQFTVKGDDGAVIEATDGGIRISNTSNVILYVAGATDFDAWNNVSGQFTNGHAAQLPTEVNSTIEAAAAKDFSTLRSESTAEYRTWMDRVSFDLKKDGQPANSDKTTKDLINAYTNNTGGIRNTAEGLFLEQLYYNYGRYLLISSNRYAPVPNNLQGLWVDTDSGHAPWNSDIHTNINIQMNYWPAEQNNLSELHMPLLNHIKSIASSPGCTNQAKAKNATVGWVVDTESNLFGGMSNWSDNYTIANAWYCTHLWQHYRFTKDKQFLAEYFPVMWSAAQYWAERMVPSTNGDGTYECPNEYSPEHGPQAENATAHSQQLVNELFANTLEAIEILGNESSLDATWLAKVRDRAKKSDSGLRTETYASSSNWGTTYLAYGEPILKEWKYSAFTRGANGHRHTSHLMALYPFGQVSYYSDQTTDEGKANYDLAVAARNSLAQRSDASTGWAMGWRVNLWARTLDGNHARTMINNAIVHAGSGVNYSSGGVYYNLWDAHTPFQIDGNFGVCAGISEMLIQSYDETIHLLPALPDAWADGSISGLKAVGNFTVDQTWAGSKLTEATVTSVMGGELRVQYGEELLTMMTYPGETYNFYFNDGKFSSYLAGATIVNVVEHVKAALEGNDDLDGIDAAKNAVLGISGRK